MAACHAAQHGKGGFKLSVFGFEPDKDREAMVRDSLAAAGRFRRARAEPAAAQADDANAARRRQAAGKGLGRLPDPAGLDRSGRARRRRRTSRKSPSCTSFPRSASARSGMTQQLRVEAEYADGTRRDVTAWARYDSLDDGVLSVTPSGRVTTVGKGQAAVMVRFEGQAEISLFVVPVCRQGRAGRLAEQELHRRAGRGQVPRAGHRAVAAVRRRHVRPPGLSRRDRHACRRPTKRRPSWPIDRSRQADEADRPPARPDRRSGAGHLQRCLCRLVVAQVVGPPAEQLGTTWASRACGPCTTGFASRCGPTSRSTSSSAS